MPGKSPHQQVATEIMALLKRYPNSLPATLL